MSNNAAAKEAKVFTGVVYYHNGEEVVEFPDTVLVEVGRLTGAGNEQEFNDYLCTYHAAVLLGYGSLIQALPAAEEGEEKDGRRKYLIVPDKDEKGDIVSFSPEAAASIVQAINSTLERAKQESSKIFRE
ncbi:MAG TPA: hypothetical protein VLH19_00370 [Patescibacteria group bacterium]|nr:hypothetical protein [Patescibacteria group bacterium]